MSKIPRDQDQDKDLDPFETCPDFGTLDTCWMDDLLIQTQIQEVLLKCSSEDREIFRMLFVHDMTPTEIATELNLGYKEVLMRRNHLLETVKALLNNQDPRLRPMGSPERCRMNTNLIDPKIAKRR